MGCASRGERLSRPAATGCYPAGVTHRLQIRYFAAAKDAAGRGEDTLDLDDAAGDDVGVAAIRAAIAEKRPSVAVVLGRSRLAINMRFVKDDDVVSVRGVAEVAVIPPVAGG